MDAFEVHRQLIQDYRSFSEGFVDIRDERVREAVEAQSLTGSQWPDPWLSLNPSFASGGTVDELVEDGVLHPACQSIFADKHDPAAPQPLSLYQHQREAIEAARAGGSYVLTTGTGSGKSLAYMIPIVDRVLKADSGKGIKAIVVYPMNALANSQVEELNKFLATGPEERAVTYARYTGQETNEDRQRILDDPPDVLLTNYVMLDLMLTRPGERTLLQRHATGLEFLVLDELHTYRGRQGADVAMLVRRVRDLCQAQQTLQCIGTSATMSSGTTVAEQQVDVASVATRIFGTVLKTDDVIVEALQRATTTRPQTNEALCAAVDERGDPEMSWEPTFDELRNGHLAAWVEDTFGIDVESESGRLIRRQPTTVQRAAELLASRLDIDQNLCANAVRATLLAGSRARDPRTTRPLFAFRLHQFLSKGNSIFVTAETPVDREILTEFQTVVGAQVKVVFPLAFCRECGQDYLMATRKEVSGGARFTARQQLRPGASGEGYLFISDSHEWPFDPVAEDRLPDSWKTTSGTNPVIEARRKDVPVRYVVAPNGEAGPQREGDDRPSRTAVAAWIPGTFRFCLRCGVTYEALRSSDFAKLVTLDQEGRSSAMSVIASSVLRALRRLPAGELPQEARKLLTFVDNRQDASLQAGHFNDYAQVVQLRAALYRALVAAGEEGLDVTRLDRPPGQGPRHPEGRGNA